MGKYQEPWHISSNSVRDKNDKWVIGFSENGANKRVVACVNACQGISTEALNANGVIPKPIGANGKGNSSNYRIITINGTQINFIGWHRKDLDAQHENWHYYETTEGKIYHFRSEHMVVVEEGR